MDAGALLLATVVGAVVLFVWSAVCWMVLPHHKGDVRPAGDALTGCERALKKLAPGAWYLVPHFDDFGGMKSKKLGPRYEAGPNGLLIPFPPGPAMSPMTFVKSFGLNLAESFGLALILYLPRGTLSEGLFEKIMLFACAALFLQTAPLAAQNIWWRMPWRNTLTCMLDNVVGFVLVAIAMHLVI